MASELSKAANDVLAERQRQVEAEGWTPEHDDAHSDGELGRAAAVYALLGCLPEEFALSAYIRSQFPMLWPWDAEDMKLSPARRSLVKAAALILAEIERLDRQEATRGQ